MYTVRHLLGTTGTDALIFPGAVASQLRFLVDENGATGGSWTFTLGGETATIDQGDAAAVAEAALEALTAVTAASVSLATADYTVVIDTADWSTTPAGIDVSGLTGGSGGQLFYRDVFLASGCLKTLTLRGPVVADAITFSIYDSMDVNGRPISTGSPAYRHSFDTGVYEVVSTRTGLGGQYGPEGLGIFEPWVADQAPPASLVDNGLRWRHVAGESGAAAADMRQSLELHPNAVCPYGMVLVAEPASSLAAATELIIGYEPWELGSSRLHEALSHSGMPFIHQ